MAKRLLQGNEAIALGARHAGLNFYAGYPITPASEILHTLVGTEVKVMQMEDEIASINAIIGASLAGAKAMTATSGPGFSLMQESIGLAHVIRAPLVIVNVQRVGPSTGMPTLPAQGDILQCTYGSHGDYFPIVFYPNSVAELYEYAIKAFDAAEESLSPVILLSDGYISHLYETVVVNENGQSENRKSLKRPSPLDLPLGKSNRHFTGLTHTGSLPQPANTEAHRKMIADMQAAQQRVAGKYAAYEYRENPNSDTLVISYGALSRAMYYFKERYSLYRPIRIFPVIEEITGIADKYEKIIVMEMNAGQYKKEIERLLHRPVTFISVLGGRLELPELNEMLQKSEM